MSPSMRSFFVVKLRISIRFTVIVIKELFFVYTNRELTNFRSFHFHLTVTRKGWKFSRKLLSLQFSVEMQQMHLNCAIPTKLTKLLAQCTNRKSNSTNFKLSQMGKLTESILLCSKPNFVYPPESNCVMCIVLWN